MSAPSTLNYTMHRAWYSINREGIVRLIAIGAICLILSVSSIVAASFNERHHRYITDQSDTIIGSLVTHQYPGALDVTMIYVATGSRITWQMPNGMTCRTEQTTNIKALVNSIANNLTNLCPS